jgi:SAM-dependent methyltransferase
MRQCPPFDVSELVEIYPDYWQMHKRRFYDTLQMLLSHVKRPKGAVLLDVGAFPGFLSKAAADAGFTVWGVSNEEITDEFTSFADRHGIAIRQCDIEASRLPFQDKEFDAVLFTEVLEHLHRNPFHVLDEIHRVLKPGVTLVVSTPNLARWSVIKGLLKGQSPEPSLRTDIHEAFPLNPNFKHCREYTQPELIYLLSEQDKYLYVYSAVQVAGSLAWDTTWREVLPTCRRLYQPINAFRAFVSWALPRALPRYRSNLIAVAKRPGYSEYIPVSQLQGVAGFHEIQTDTELPSIHRRPIEHPFRWTRREAQFILELPATLPPGTLRIRLQVGNLAPLDIPPATCAVSLNGLPANELTVAPSKSLRVIDLALPSGMQPGQKLSFQFRSSTWTPRAYGLADDRELGVIVSWDAMHLYGCGESK